MPDFKYNLRRDYDNNLNSYKIYPDVPVTTQAYVTNTKVNDWSANYGYFDWMDDAASDFFRSMQIGQMHENQDVMRVTLQNSSDAQSLLEAWEQMDSAATEEDLLKAQEQALQSLESLRKNGTWSNSNNPTKDDLTKIIQTNQQKYKDAEQDYLINLDEYNSSVANYDISQYYTRKSNEAVMGWGNWFYKLPPTQGTSSTSIVAQTSSMVGGYAGAKAGAAIGSFIAPGIGTAIGAGLGALAGGQFLGGIQARQDESHMEAFMAQYEKLMKIADEKQIDLNKVANNVRDQLKQKGINTDNMDQQMLIQAAMSMDGIVSGLSEFDDAAKESFVDSRRVYEANNALGFGEALSDLTYIVPAGKWIKRGFGKVATLATNKLSSGLLKRFKTGVEIAKTSSKLRNKQLWDHFVDIALTTPFRSAMEATEEGAQAMIVDEFLDDKFSEDYSNATFVDAVKDGQVATDLLHNTQRRISSLGAALNLNPEYKDDQQFAEEMLMGAIMPLTNPQGIVANAVKFKNAYDKIYHSKKVGDYFSEALQTQDLINRNTKLFKLMREGVGSNRTYLELLSDVRNMMKQKDASGKTKFNLDTTVLTEDGSIPTDKDIDDFFDNQVKEFEALRDIKTASKKQLKQINFDKKEDEDLFLALKYNAQQDVKNLNAAKSIFDVIDNVNVAQIAEDENFKELVSNVLNKTPNKEQLAVLAKIALLNTQTDYLDETIQQNATENILRNLFSNQKLVTNKTLLEGAKSLISFLNAKQSVMQQRDELVSQYGEEKDTLLLLDIPTIDSENYSKYLKFQAQVANVTAALDHAKQKQEQLNGLDLEYIKQAVEKYKQTQHRQAVLADNANEAARTHTTPSVPKEIKDSPKVEDLTKEQVEQQRSEIQQEISKNIETFNNLLQQIPETSYLHALVQQIQRGVDVIENDPLSYVRYVNRLMSRLKTQYENASKEENVTEEEKQQFKNLQTIADNFGKQLKQLRMFNAEAKAKAERHNLGLQTRSTVWFDDAGNRYIFDNKKAEYSENEGVILYMRPVVEEEDKDLSNTITQLKKNKEKLEKEDSDKNEKLIKDISQIIESLEAMQNNATNKTIIINANNAFLRTLTTKDNLGNQVNFESKIESYLNNANRKIANNKQHRKQAQEYSTNGDVYEFDINDDESNKRTSPKYKETEIEDSPEREVLAKAYPLNTAYGAKQSSKLTNPYHAAKYWHGKITMPYKDENAAKEYFVDKEEKVDYGIVSRHIGEVSRYRAIKTFHKIGGQIVYIREHNKALDEHIYTPLEQLAKGEVDEIKIGGAKITKFDYDEMVYALPLIAQMYQAHTGGQATVLHLADFASRYRTTKPNQSEYNSRVELINNLLLSYKRTNQRKDLEDAEGIVESEVENNYGNAVYFGEKTVQLVYGDFDYNTVTEMNPNLNIYTDDLGNQMSKKQINDLYKNRLPNALQQIEPYIDDLVSLLNSAEMGYELKKEELTQVVDGDSKLSKLILAVVKYGDGVIDLYGTFMPTVSELLGGIKNKQKGIKDVNLARARKLLSFFQSKTPEMFLSYKNTQDSERRTPPVQISVEEAVEGYANWFRKESAIQIKTADGESLDYTNTPENIEDLSQMFKRFEKAIRESRTAEEFLEKIEAGHTFELNGSKDKARDVLAEYFINRRFSRLKNPSNIVQAITLGTATPLNGSVDYKNFNRIVKHKQDRIDKVSSLGLVKNEKGEYHFSLEEWEARNIRLRSNAEANEAKTEFETLIDAAKEQVEAQKKEIEGITLKADLLHYVIDHKSQLTQEFYDLLVRTKKDGTVVFRKYITVAGAKRMIFQQLDQVFESKLSELEENYKNNVRKEISTLDEFEGMTTLPLTFAFGSYATDDGASVIRYDRHGNKVKMQYANGTPGAMYLVIPSFLTASRNQIPVKLNPKRFDKPMATLIASLLKAVQNGLNQNTFVSTLNLPEGFEVQTDMTVKSLLESLIYLGKQDVIDNPSDETYERLLYVEDDGKVFFGETFLTEDNFSQLVDFIMNKKTYRIDREKAGNQHATFGGNVLIKTTKDSEFGEQILFKRNADDNYIASVIDNGLLLTDLNQSAESNLFTTPSVYIKYNKKRSFVTSPNDPDANNSAANAKKKLNQDLKPASREEIESDIIESETQKTNVAEYAQELMRIISDAVSKAYSQNKITGTSYILNLYGLKSKKLGKTNYEATLSSDEVNGTTLSVNDTTSSQKLLADIIKNAEKGNSTAVVVRDEEGEFVKVDGKTLLFAIKSFAKNNKEGIEEKSESSSLKTIETLWNQVAQSLISFFQTGQVSNTTQTVEQKSKPSGYVGLKSEPKKQIAVQDAKVEEATVAKQGDTYTWEYNGLKVEWNEKDSLETVEERLDTVSEGMATDEEFDSLKRAYEQSTQKEKPALSVDTAPKNVPSGTLSATKPPTPITKFEKPITDTKSQKNSTTQQLTVPSWNQVLEFAKNDQNTKDLLKKITDLQNRLVKNPKQYKTYVEALYSKYLQQVHKVTLLDAAKFVKDNTELVNVINNISLGKEADVKYGSIYTFLDEHVQKEDFDKALATVEKILGKNFDYSFLPEEIEKKYDKVRGAMIYVFGQCGSAGIRLFRDASTNTIARGSFYHEAFHKVSLFILSEKERQQMYNEARNKYEQLRNSNNTEIEEFLADQFAQFVLDSELQKEGKYYSTNPIYKLFQKIFDPIRSIINRLSKANVTPEYVDMNKLFKDMYSGRYAYAKATSKNKELFDKIYSGFTPFAGFKVDDVEIAESASQYNEILRDLVARFIRTTDLLHVTNGNVQFDPQVLKQDLLNDLNTYVKALDHLNARRSWKNDPILKSFSTEDVDIAIIRMLHLIDTLKFVLRDDSWNKWVEVLTGFINTQFNLSKNNEEDPQTVADIQGFDRESIEGGEDIYGDPAENNGLHISKIRDSYMTDMFDASHPNMKLLLWSISQFDPNDPGSGKFTPDGLIEYANVKQVYLAAVTAISKSINVQDMLSKLERAATAAIAEQNDYSLAQLHSILSDERVPQALRNRFFADFVRNINQFENHVYEKTDVVIGKTANNKNITSPRYTASVRSGNTDIISEKLNVRWKTGIIIALDRLRSSQIPVKSVYTKVKSVINEASAQDLNSIIDSLNTLNQYYGFGTSDDVVEDAKIVQTIMRRGNKNILHNVLTPFAVLSKSTLDKHQGINDFVSKLFSEKSVLTSFVETMSVDKKANSKTNSVRGPKGTNIYAISAYNFITRLFNTRVTEKEWQDRMRNNPYCQHSVWLKQLLGNSEQVANVKIKLGTILDEDYLNSTADVDVTELEDLINRFTSVLSGKHLIPSLANKRFAADIDDFENMQDLFDTFGSINPKMIDRFVGYLADEILAISDAMYTRQWFIDSLNKIIKPKKLFTVESFSKLSATQQEDLFKSNSEAASLLSRLVNQYHFVEGKPEFKTVDGRLVKRTFHIDLTKGSGYKFRHFHSLNNDYVLSKIRKHMNEMSKDVFTDNSRKSSATIAESIAENYRNAVVNMLNKNILITVDKMIDLGIIAGNKPSVDNLSIDKASLVNRFLPSNLLANWNGKTNNKRSKTDYNDLYNSIGYFTIQGMSDVIEFEKIVSGDIGYHKNITSVNKRYSGITSTFQITAEQGTIQNVFSEDRLYDSPTFNTVTLNTSFVINTDKFVADMKTVLGEDVVTNIEIKDGELSVVTDASKLLENDEFTNVAMQAPLVKRYIESRNEGRLQGLDKNGKPLSNKALAEQIVKDAENRFLGFLDNDPTDASVFITADAYRQFRQREGNWNDVDEACHNLLENYDNITSLSKTHKKQLQDLCNTLKLDYNLLIRHAQKYDKAVKNNDRKYIDQYKGMIISATSQLQATSLKYVYYGEPANRHDKLYVPIYDKMSLSPIYKIFAEGHEMYELYSFMRSKQVDMVKLNSAVKIGSVPCFELFDENGHIDKLALENSTIQSQYFELIGKQLNTDAHEMHDTALLTQFMKIAMLNVEDDQTYHVGGTSVKGSTLKQVYIKLLDHFTEKGLQNFNKEFGIDSSGVDKDVFMKKLQKMALTQSLPADTVSSFKTSNGEYVIHPAGLPNMRWIQSRILSEMGKKVIDTMAPGQALYQVASVGYDNLFNLKQHSDKHLLMPGENGAKRMQIKLSISFFEDVINEAKKKGIKDYNLDNFEGQRKFVLDNQELFALSYRVPTQGQNSTLPVEIVDVFPPQRGAIIMFPAGITALTGSDFDIDKMFLARPNYEVVDGKLQKVSYNFNKIITEDLNKINDKELQNALLDMYQAILTSKNHYLAANTPLDVCTGPIKSFITEEIIKKQGSKRTSYEQQDGYYANPVFQTEQKLKNAESNGGIGPMALNSVFRFFVQASELQVRKNTQLEELGLDNMVRVYDRNGSDILDTTSALINAFVDATKDNWIGMANVNSHTYDITSFLITSGFGNDTFAFLTQPIIKEVAQKYILYKNGKLGITEIESKGEYYLEEVRDKWVELNQGKYEYGLAEPKEMSEKVLKRQLTEANPAQQLRYLNTFLFLKEMAQGYKDAIRSVQIDTKKYGINLDEVISFMQSREQFVSNYNLTFQNPEDLFTKTFLGTKFEKGLVELFKTFSDTLLEFSPIYKNAADELSRQYGKYGRYSKQFLRRVGPKIKTVLLLPFFNEYLVNRFDGKKPLQQLTVGANSVPGRFNAIKRKCYELNEGLALFEVLEYNPVPNINIPHFFTVDRTINEDAFVKSNVQAAISEMFNSNDEEIRQWAADFAVYMFYLTGGDDSSAGGLIKTTLYDVIPPQHLANIKAGNQTFNQYVETLMTRRDKLSLEEMDHVMRLAALTDDSIIKTFDPRYDSKNIFVNKFDNDNVLVIKKGSHRFFSNDQDSYDRFIKVYNMDSKTYDVYKLGNILESKGKDGRIWTNPVYFKVQKLGYRNSARVAFSVRSDGYIDSSGKIQSMLQRDINFTAERIDDLSDKVKEQILKNATKVYNPLEFSSDEIYANINKADVVFFVNSGKFDKDVLSYKNYAEYKNKEFYIISDSEENIPTISEGKTFTIIGHEMFSGYENPYVSGISIIKSILNANSDRSVIISQGYAKNTAYGVTIENYAKVATDQDKSDIQKQIEAHNKKCNR